MKAKEKDMSDEIFMREAIASPAPTSRPAAARSAPC